LSFVRVAFGILYAHCVLNLVRIAYGNVLSVLIGTSGTVIAEQNHNSAESNIAETPGPNLVLTQVFDFLQNGKADEAAALFSTNTPEQEKAVLQYVKGGAAFFTANPQINNRVVQTFTHGNLALCAIEQTSTEHPDQWELERGFLIKNSGRWLLLPIQQDYRSYKNELSSDDVSLFATLVNDFSSFRRNYK